MQSPDAFLQKQAIHFTFIQCYKVGNTFFFSLIYTLLFKSLGFIVNKIRTKLLSPSPLKVEKFKSDQYLHSFNIQPMLKKVGKVTLYFDGLF